MKTAKARQRLWGILFFFPFGAGFSLFYLAPFLRSLARSFFRGQRFAGFANYLEVFQSGAFLLAMKNTLCFLAVGLPLVMAGSFFLALALYRHFRGSAVFQSLFLFPMILPASCIAVLLRAFFEQHGGCNALLARLGLPVQQWLQSGWAFVILVGLFVWKNLGYDVVLLLAGLNSLPRACIEAARLDGASPLQLARRVLLPLLRPVLLFTLTVSAANSFKCFREAWLLGGDTPHRSIYMLQHFLNNNFSNANEARLAVAAVSLFAAAAAAISLVYAKAVGEEP